MADLLSLLNDALQGRYRVRQVLGEGGMATVYLADDVRHHRAVALKVLRPELAAMVGAERFLAEIRTTAALQHPHILPLFDSGEADGFLFYVMPFVSGPTMAQRLAEGGRLDLGEAVRIADALAHALQHAHGHGVVHRDVKPGNVLLQDGEAQLADFGIALTPDHDGRDRLTRTGQSIGTPGFMSPEQAAGDQSVDARSDVYSLGALTFAMITGQAPFADRSAAATLARVLTEPPPDAREVDRSIPESVARVVQRAMAKEPGDRFTAATGFAEALVAALGRSRAAASGSRTGPRGALAAAAVLGVAGLLAIAWGARPDDASRIRAEVIPEIQRLLGEGEQARAYALARSARGVLPDDPTLQALFEAATAVTTVTSTPPGARLYYRVYGVDDTTWSDLGATPVDGVRLPSQELLIRLEREGYRTYHASLTPALGARPVLTPLSDPAEVAIPAGTLSLTGSAVAIDAFWIDEHEVTNAEYQRFVDAGGYPLDLDVAGLSSPESGFDAGRAERELVDRTGRPGPAGWELSRYEAGRETHPVGGVSWFEAVAYCASRGRSVPTYYHWKYADGGEISPWDGALRHANLGTGDAPAPVGSSHAYSPRGVSDMAGNVREWVWNESRGERYVLGGSWSSPPHMATDYDAADPWSRDEENGFRCARYASEPASELLDPIETPVFDFNGYRPVDDAVFASLAAFYDYDWSELDPTGGVVGETEDWTREYVQFDAAYLDERVAIHLFVPKAAAPPYQAVVYFPGSSATVMTSSENISEMSQMMWVPLSGRALLYPVLKGTYERRHARPSRGMAELRQRYVWMVQDIMRAVDYIESRADLDEERIAYFGLSLGGEIAVPVALEKRFRTAVLVGAALDPEWRGNVPEAAAPWNFVSRITTPTLVVNGRNDFMHPYEQSQIPFFEAIDVPEADKSFVVLEAGHVPPNNEVIRHALDWLDERMGPVELVRARR